MDDKNLNQNKSEKKELTGKGVTLIAIGALLVVLIVAGTAAWFTRVSAINQLTMEAANFDFKANFTQEPFIIRAKDYIDILSNGQEKAAPGTTGVIPVWLSADESEVTVNYTMNISYGSMDEEFRKRLRFFYIKCNEQGKPVDQNGNVITDFDITPPVEVEFSNTDYISGTLPAKEGHYEYIYWEWVYDLDPKKFFYIKSGDARDHKWLINQGNWYFSQMYGSTPEEQESAKLAFDEFDTGIGMGKFDDIFPKSSGDGNYEKETITVEHDGQQEEITILAYQKAMEVKVDMVGAQATPTYDADPGKDRELEPGEGHKYGSGYVPLAKLIEIHNKDINTGK